MNASFEAKLNFYSKVRSLGREQVSFGDYSNAADLYSRCAQVLKSVPKAKLELMNEQDRRLRAEALTTLFTNIALCMIKKKLPEKAIRAAKDALEADPTNFKAFLRMGQA